MDGFQLIEDLHIPHAHTLSEHGCRFERTNVQLYKNWHQPGVSVVAMVA